MGMGLTAVLVKYSFPYNWSWIQCLLFGGVLSATDPVAVAAIMSEVSLNSFATRIQECYTFLLTKATSVKPFFKGLPINAVSDLKAKAENRMYVASLPKSSLSVIDMNSSAVM